MDEKALTVKAGDQLAKDVIAKVTNKAAKVLDGLYLEPHEPGYNPDAEKTWAECSMKTRASLILVKDAQARGDGGEGRVLGLILVKERASSKEEWELMARKVDEDERNRNAIEVKVDE